MSSLPTPKKGLLPGSPLWIPWSAELFWVDWGWVIDQCFRTLETWGDGVATGCSEGCAVMQSGLAETTERLVVAHYRDSCVPWVDLGLSWMNLEGRVD
jgi:hypothetical protein